MTGPLSTTGTLLTAPNLTLSACGEQATGRPKALAEQAVQAGQQLLPQQQLYMLRWQ